MFLKRFLFQPREFRRFEEPGDEGGHTPAVDLLPGPEDAGGGDEDERSAEPAAPTAPAFDPKAFAETFGQTIASSLRGAMPQAPAEPALTPEEAKKLLKFWEPDDVFLQKFGNLETQKEAFALMRDGLTQQFMTILQTALEEREKGINQRFTPALTFIQQHEATQRESRFNAAFPQLADPALKPIVGHVIQHLSSTGALSGDENARFKAIAAGVEAVIKHSNPTFKLNPPQAGGRKSNPNALPSTTRGSGGASGNGKATGAPSGKSWALSHL